MGLVSCQAAYENGAEWVDALVAYLDNNYNYARDFIAANLPKIKVAELEGTYLLWLDLNAYAYSEAELDKLITEKAGLWVSNGVSFGDEGRGFIRINIACPLVLLKTALDRLVRALNI